MPFTMPQETAAQWSNSVSPSTSLLSSERAFIQERQSWSATQAPVIEAVRVPPSAWMTSQSMVIWRSPSAGRSMTERRLRPIRRWISTVRPLCLPDEASRRVRSWVARGSMPYSAVTQPRPWPLSHGGRRSSRVAVTSTCVSPNFTKQEPSAYFTTPRSIETARSSSGCRRLGRMSSLPWRRKLRAPGTLVGGPARADKGRQTRLFRLDASVLDHLAPFAELDLHRLRQFLGRAGERLEARVGELLA